MIKKVVLYELQSYQTQRGKSKLDISLFRRKIYQLTDIEEICSIFNQVWPVVSHLEFSLPENPRTPKEIRESLK